jgi:hypothetical protein
MLARLLIVAIGKYIFPLFSEDAKSVLMNPGVVPFALFLLETILLFSIITSRISQGSILKST